MIPTESDRGLHGYTVPIKVIKYLNYQKVPIKGATVDPSMGFWADFWGPANSFEALS